MIVSQQFKEITLCKTAKIISTIIIQRQINNIQIQLSKEYINQMDTK